MTHPNRVRLSKLTLGLLAALATAPVFAQATSAGVGGTVTRTDGQPVAGAEVVITHVESGTVSRATTDASGRYTARGLRVGGPYTVTITKSGEGTKTEDNVYLDLNKTNTINAALTGDLTTLDTVTAVAIGGSDVFSATKMGSGTSISRQTIEGLPSVNGNIQDYMRLDPRVAFVDRASGTISAGGQNPRYNAVRIDGVSASDTFGLEGNNMPTRRQPVAMEAIEAINIDLANYDVTISGATGAVVDAVTKSGTNEFHGSVYGTYRDGDWFGDDPEGNPFNGFSKEENYGFTLGGPLVKDRLFFFANYDKFKQEAPGADIAGSALGKANPTIDMADIAEAQSIATGYGIDAGGLDSDGNTDLEEYALKLDWNISDAHRASVRYSKLEQSKLRINGVNSTQISLSSYWYQQPKEVESYVAQLFSDWTDTFSTEFKVSYRDYSAVRETPTTAPSVQIYFTPAGGRPLSGDSLFLGTETNSQQNALYTKTWNYFGAATLTLGDHDLKAGVDYSTNEIYNIFGPQLYGVYQFASMADFRAGRYSTYNLRTPQAGQGFDSVAADYQYNNLGLFIQDQWFVSPNLTLTFGVRADKPTVDSRPAFNASAQTAFGLDNSQVLDEKFLIQPRFGFNYTFDTERPTQLRGGLGLFQGDSPQVWLSNAYNTTGFNYIQYTLNAFRPDTPFSGDGLDQNVPPSVGNQLQNVNFIAPDFDQPSVWKANLAFDHELPWQGLVASAELLVTEVKSALFYQNLNLGDATEHGQDGREIYYQARTSAGARVPWATATNRFNRNRAFGDVYLLDTTDKGYSRQATFSLTKPWTNDSDWSWSLAYTYTDAEEVSGLTSSTASSGWNYNYVFQANEESLATSRYEIKDRISGQLNWKHKFFGDNNTSVGLFYVPSGPGDVVFGTLAASGVSTANPAMEAAFFEYLAAHPELARYAGQVTPKNAARAGFVNTFDIRISQELPGFFEGHKSEIWLDIVNVGNLLNKDWGHIYDYGFFADQRIATLQGIDNNGKYVYNFTNPDAPTIANGDADGFNQGVSQWSLQVGFRYKF